MQPTRILVAVILFLVPSAGWAAPTRQAHPTLGVGDEVHLQLKTVENLSINTDALRGKLVLLDFWATWCGPCMQEAPHMVDVFQKYNNKGLVMLGISLDDGPAEMKQIAVQKGLVWPQTIDLNRRFSEMFGVTGIPHTVLIGPDGHILWKGHPAGGLDQAIERAFKEHPPQLVDPKVLASANAMLDEVSQKTQAGDTRGAIKLLGKVPAAARADEAFAAKAADAQKKLEESANGMLDGVQKQIDAGQYTEAVAKLRELSDALTGLPVAGKARKMLGELMSRPEARAAIAHAEKNQRANEALAAAEKLKAEKKHELAYAHFKEIVKAFAGTDAAKKAGEEVAGYEKDPAFLKHVTESSMATRARGALSMAESYRRAGRMDLARTKYQSVIDEFPGTSYSETAKRALKDLGD